MWTALMINFAHFFLLLFSSNVYVLSACAVFQRCAMPQRLSLNNETDVASWEKPHNKQWGLDGELSAWRSFRWGCENTNTNTNTNPIRRGCEGLNQGADLEKKSCEVDDKGGKVEKEDEGGEDVFRLLHLPEELLEVLGKYLDVATTLALASTCSLLQATQKYKNCFWANKVLLPQLEKHCVMVNAKQKMICLT